ncbi:MAG: hypothetical protein AB1601_09095 [Planctomycetota bacterium]
MIVTLDGQRVDESFRPGCKLQAVVDQVRSHMSSAKRIIVSVAVNGERLDDDVLTETLERPVESDAQVDLESSEPAELVERAFRGLAESFSQAADGIDPMADGLKSSDPTRAMHDVGDFVTLWQTAYRAIAQCSGLLNRDLTACEFEGQPVIQCIATLVDRLSELRGALEARDMVLLADLVRYELQPLARSWQALLISLAEQVQAPAAQPS